MAKRSYPSNDFYKHRDGPKRQARMNEWYENKQGHAEAKNFFSAENVVPNNPTNYQSFTPVASQFAPEGQPAGDVVFRRNPYGCLLYTSPSPRDVEESRMPSSA